MIQVSYHKVLSDRTNVHRIAEADCWYASVCMFYDSFSHFMEFSDGTILHRTAERDTWFAYVCMFPDHFSSTFSDGTTVFKIAETYFWFAYVCMFHDSRIHGILSRYKPRAQDDRDKVVVCICFQCSIFQGLILSNLIVFSDSTKRERASVCVLSDSKFPCIEFSDGTTVHNRAERDI